MNSKNIVLVLSLSVCISYFNLCAAAETVNKSNLQNTNEKEDAFETRFDELTALLNWAAYLSGYKTNGINPQLQFRPHQFFVDNACLGNKKCKVIGWYNDQDIVYVDDRLVTLDSRFERSLVVHEFVHYLQHISGEFEAGTCEAFVQREREAYTTQRAFIMTYGVAPTMSFHQHSCTLEFSQKKQLAAQQKLH